MALDYSTLSLQNKFLENKSGRIFLALDKFTLQILAKNLGVCKPAFYTFYTAHLGWKSTIYHADLGQNAVFHNFFKDKLHSVIQDDQSWAFSETDQKNFQNHPYGQMVLISSASCQCGRVFEWTLIELRFNIITNLLLLFFVI